ncbi:MAG: CHAT domain-containing protein [Chitinophagales bacterium]
MQKALHCIDIADYKNCIAACLNAAKAFKNLQEWRKYVQVNNLLIEAYLELSQYEKAQQRLAELQTLIPTKLPKESIEEVHYANHQGDYWNLKHDYSKALQNYQNAYQIRQHLFDEKSIEIADSYNRIGKIFGQKGEFEKEMSYYRKALKISNQNLQTQYSFTVDCYQKMGSVYGLKGDYNTQLIYLQKALDICLQHLDKQHILTASILDGVGRAYAMKERFTKSLDFHRKALSIRVNVLSEFHHHLADSYFHIGYCLQSLEQFEEALEEYNKSYRIRKKIFGKNDASVAACYNNMGVCFGHLRKFFRQFDYHHKALEILLKIFGIQHHEVAFTYNQLGICWQRRNFHAQALQQFQFALISLVEGFDSPNIYQNPRLKKYEINLELLNAFSNKATSLFHHYQTHSQSKKDLRRAMVAFHVSLELIDRKRHSFQSEHSKLDLIHRFMPVYEGAIQTALELYRLDGSQQYLHFAFTLAEKGKSVLLLSSIKDLEAKGIANIPAAMTEKEKYLRQQIANLEKSIYQEQTIEDQANELRMSKLQNHLFDYQQQYQDLVENLEQEYPNYYQLKYKFEVLDVHELQTALKREDANSKEGVKAYILEYFVGEQNIYIFLITAETLQYHIVEKPDDFEKMVKKMIRTINQLSRQKFAAISHELYELLFPQNLQNQLQITDHNTRNKLYIIPDASLFYLPFEALLFEALQNKKTPYGELPYLIRQFSISYHYSTSLLYNSLQKKQEQSTLSSYVGFAPIYKSATSKTSPKRGGEVSKKIIPSASPAIQKNAIPSAAAKPSFTSYPAKPKRQTMRAVTIEGKTYHELVHTKSEVQAVQKLFVNKDFNAKSFFHEEASISNFLKQVADSKFIHIAAHGIFNKKHPEFSGIAFSPSEQGAIFYISDAYHLQLQADLVVLSSCESGIGKLSKSEGMMAMNRALLYAGANNVIFTLFKVYDESASRLTYLIFEGIVNRGLTYSEALQDAKLELIKDITTTPKSWAGFVLLGG